jgi:hypothetical protein
MEAMTDGVGPGPAALSKLRLHPMIGDLVDRYAAVLEQLPAATHPHHVTPEMRRLLDESGDADALNRAAMRRLIERARTGLDRLPPEVADYYRRDLVRIEAGLSTEPPGTFVLPNDVFAKDLCICRGSYLPAGAQVVHLESGVPRSVALKGGPLQFIAATAFLLRYGHAPYYEIHTHTPALPEFSEEGWNRCYLRIAAMLRANPQVKGMVGGAWFYDPKLEEVSPRLSYLRQVPLSAGARAFYWGGDEATNISYATKTSASRRKLYEEGKYKPVAYMLVWPRAKLLGWAERHRHLLAAA